MADEQIRLVTFQLGPEYYGIDISYVKEIYATEAVRPIPNTPSYITGILNLRGEVIPIISLHDRFHIEAADLTGDDKLLSGFIILKINGLLAGITIDRVQKVVSYERHMIQPPPQIISGINGEYIQGVVHEEEHYLILLDIISLFSKDDFMGHISKIAELGKA